MPIVAPRWLHKLGPCCSYNNSPSCA